jgi:nicotinate-nucleotide adenylyltransferase
MKKIAIFGGSFNPPHLGHAAVVSAIISHKLADEIWLMPAPSRLHKPIPMVAENRMAMTKLFIEDLFQNSPILVLATDFEIKHSKELTSYQSKIKLEQEFPGNEFIFIFGTDVLPFISSWPDGSKFITTSKIIAIDRPGTKHLQLPANITLLSEYDKKDTSSTKIRSAIHQKQDASGFLTPSVLKFIQDKNLYL